MSAAILLPALAALSSVPASPARAGSIFQWVCDNPTCNGDPAFSMTIEFADGVVAPNASFTGIAGNVNAITVHSGVGDGVTLTLADLSTGTGSIDDVTNFQVTFDATGTVVKDLFDASSGTNLTFFNFAIGRIDLFEGSLDSFGYSAGSLNDFSPTSVFEPTQIFGRLVFQSSTGSPPGVPERGTLAIIAVGLIGIGAVKRKRRA